MLELTVKAKRKFEILLDEHPGETIRLQMPVESYTSLEYVFDQQRKGDTVFKNDAGDTLFVIQEELAESLDGIVMDYRQFSSGDSGDFTFSRVH